MIRFQIPKAYLPGFEILLSLQPEQFNLLLDFLKKIPVGTGPQTFANLFDEHFKTHLEINRQLAATLYSLGSFKLNLEKVSQTELIESLSNSFFEQTKKKPSQDDLIKLKEILVKLFDANSTLTQTFKGFQLLSENDTVFRENHIITDMRLLFKDELADSHRYALIIHQLKIRAEVNGEQDDYYFSLNNADLHRLQDQITRAIEKEKLIRDDYKKNISFITITE